MNPDINGPSPQLAEKEPKEINALPIEFSNKTIIPDVQSVERPAENKFSVKKIILVVIVTALAIPVIFALFIVSSFFLFIVNHESELSRLEKETTSLFQGSNITVTNYDCHDVELRNQCYFKITQSNDQLSDFLRKNGFSEDSTSEKEYKKGKLSITSVDSDEDKGNYESHYSTN